MDDSRLRTAKEECMEVLKELDADYPDVPRALQLLKSARESVVTVVGEALAMYGKHDRDLNGLDAARTYINRSAKLLEHQPHREWVFSHAQQFSGYAVDALQVVLSGNVVPLRRKPNSPGGGAA